MIPIAILRIKTINPPRQALFSLVAIILFLCSGAHADVFIQDQIPTIDIDAPELTENIEEEVAELERDAVAENKSDEPLDEPVGAKDRPDDNMAASPLETAIVEGYGAVINNDVAAARDAALADAHRRAIEQVAGVKLFTHTEIEHGIMLRDDVTVETIGLVIDTEILEQGLLEGGLYRIVAQVTVATDPLQATMFRFAPRDRIAIFVTSTNNRLSVTPIVERLTVALIDAGYSVIDPDITTPDIYRTIWQSYKTGELHVLPHLGPVWEFPVLLHGEIQGESPETGSFGYSCAGSIHMKLLSTYTGEILKQFHTAQSITGLGKTKTQAVSDLERRLADRAAVLVIESLVPDIAKTIRLRVKNLPSDESYRDLINHIQGLRFVRAVQNREPWNAWLTRFDVVVECDASVLADELKHHANITVISITENELELLFESE